MQIQISDLGTKIRVVQDGAFTDIEKDEIVSTGITGDGVAILYGNQRLVIRAADVTSPSVVNNEYLLYAIDTMTAASEGAQTITSSVVTDDATITAGATSIGFTTSSDFVGTINGVTREASTFYGFEAATGKTLPAIAYVTTAGSITIDKIV